MTSRIAKVAIALVAAAAGVAGLSSAAIAGEGGVAGGAAFSIDATTGNVTGVAVSAAVGKEGAAAGAFNYAAGDVANSAFAVGNAGTLTLDAVGSPTEFGVVTEQDTRRGRAQNNSFTSGFNVQLGTSTGDDLVTSPVGDTLGSAPTPAEQL